MNESINICSVILCLCFYDGYTFEMAIVVLGTNKLVFYIMQSLIYKDLSAPRNNIYGHNRILLLVNEKFYFNTE